jgi:hypothetical protein
LDKRHIQEGEVKCEGDGEVYILVL